MLTIDQREMTVPGGGVYRGGGGSWFRRILVPVSAPDQAYPALAERRGSAPRATVCCAWSTYGPATRRCPSPAG